MSKRTDTPILPLRMPDLAEFRFARQFQRKVVPVLRRSVVPLFAANLEALEHVGSIAIPVSSPISHVATGTLFAAEDAHYVVTADHVIADFTAAGRQLRIGMGDPPRPQPINVSDEFVRRDPARDVAVIRLEPSAVNRLYRPFFLTWKHVRLVQSLEDANYLLAGFLADGSRPSPDYMSFVLHNFDCWATAYSGQISSPSFQPDAQVLLKYDHDGWDLRSGLPVRRPHALHGMSGTSVWRVFRGDETDGSWSFDNLKVVAVENRVFDKDETQVVCCTLWKHVADLIDPSVA